MLKEQLVRNVLSYALDKGIGFAELFVEDKEELNIRYHNRAVQEIAQARLSGAGMYLISGLQSAYVYLNDLSEKGLLRAVDSAAELLTAKGEKGQMKPFQVTKIPEICPVQLRPSIIRHGEKIHLLQEADKLGRAGSAYLVDLLLSFNDTDQKILVANSEGIWAEDRRVTSRLRLTPTLQKDMELVGHFVDFSKAQGFEAFRNNDYLRFTERKIKSMEEELFAEEAPSGVMPVIFEGGSCSGTFFHEACGHQLESGHILKGGLFRDKLGQQIASEKVSLIDDGTLPGQYGSSKFDDEGRPRQRNILIENGVLKSYLVDHLGALRLGISPTGSGRRQGYGYAPAARMSNTFLAAGPDDPDEIIRSTAEGLFVTEIGGGTGGDEFSLMAQKAYLIKNGQIDRPVKGAMLLGRGDVTMKNIDRVGNQLIYEEGGAFCGADSGLVCTSTSGARMRVSEMLVGGKG